MREEILFTRKLTDIEYRFQKSSLSSSWEFLKTLPDDEDTQRSLASHLRQMRNSRLILDALRLNPSQIAIGEVLVKERVDPYRLVIASGGDDYLKYVGHFIDSQLLAGVNLDPETSNGALMPFTAESFVSRFGEIISGSAPFAEWTRLQAAIDGVGIPELAVSEVFVGDPLRLKSSKYLFHFQEEDSRVSNSGLLVATGAGSTGWYRAAASCKHEEAPSFPRTAMEARFVATEAFFNRLISPSVTQGEIRPGDILQATYTAHGSGVVSIDSVHDYPLLRGHKVSVRISDLPLRVVMEKDAA